MPRELASSVSRIMSIPPAWKERFARGLFPEPGQCVGRPPFNPSWRRWVSGSLQLPHLLEGGYAFTDGSGLDQHHPTLRVAGWSVVVYDRDRRYVGAMFGAVPPEFGIAGTARDGEDFAMLMCSQNLLGCFTVRADCKGTLSCCQSPLMAMSARNPRAHLRRQVHAREDFCVRPFRAC